MATKAQLEQEVARLRRELDAAKAPPPAQAAAADATSGATPDAEAASGSEADEEHGTQDELGEMIAELAHELEGAAARKPVLAALAAFAIGLVLGRAMSR